MMQDELEQLRRYFRDPARWPPARHLVRHPRVARYPGLAGPHAEILRWHWLHQTIQPRWLWTDVPIGPDPAGRLPEDPPPDGDDYWRDAALRADVLFIAPPHIYVAELKEAPSTHAAGQVIMYSVASRYHLRPGLQAIPIILGVEPVPQAVPILDALGIEHHYRRPPFWGHRIRPLPPALTSSKPYPTKTNQAPYYHPTLIHQ